MLDRRKKLTTMVMRLLNLWGLSPRERRAVLGLAPRNTAALARFQSGTPMTGRVQIERIMHLLRIHESLRLLFPQNRDLAYRWMTTKNKAFTGRTPVQAIIRTRGMAILDIREYLAVHTGLPLRDYDWHMIRAKREYQRACAEAVARGEETQESMIFIPVAVARAATVHFPTHDDENPAE